jgi:cytochrome P450
MSRATKLPVWPWYELNRDCPLDPPPLLSELRSEGGLARIVTVMGDEAWLVTRHKDAVTVLGDRRFSADRRRPGFPFVGPPRPIPPGNFIHIDPPEHTRLRRLVTRNFTAGTVARLRPGIQARISGLLDDIALAGPPADLKRSLALPLPVQTIAALIGIPARDAHIFPDATREFMRTDAPIEAVRERVRPLKTYLEELVEAKQRDPGEDLISHLLLDKEPDGHITRDELVGISMVLMLGGYETTSNMIALTILMLLAHPAQLDELKRDPELIKGAVEEALRYTSVIHTGLPRIATEDIDVGGQLVRADDGVIVALSAANRDESAYTDADVLDIHRFEGHREAPHVAFGFGIHQCLGQMLAREQLRLVVGELLHRFPGIRLEGTIADVPFRHDMSLYGIHELPVTWTD